MADYDVIIAGAGPAGSTAGYILNKYGFKVLVIDKAVFPRQKLCGGLITFKTYELIKRIFNLSKDDLKNLIGFSSKRYKVFYQDKLIFSGVSDKTFCFIQRDKYDSFFLNILKKQGVDVIEGECIVDVNYHKNEIITSSNHRIKAKYIIGADGVNSIIRKNIPVFDFKRWKNNLAIAIETFTDEFTTDEPHIYLGFIDMGYGWVFPNKNRTILGMGRLIGSGSKKLITSFKVFLKKFHLKSLDSTKGHLFPYGNFLKRLAYDNIILAGDAGGIVDPLLGEGIFYAHRSGELSGLSIYYHNYYKRKYPLGDIYTTLMEKYLYPQLRYALKVRRIFLRKSFLSQYVLARISFIFLHRLLVDMVHGVRLYNPFRKWDDCFE